MGKIICVGFQKTGTKSMSEALQKLGYSVSSAVSIIGKSQDWGSENLSLDIAAKTCGVLDGVDAIQDSPCAFVYRELDKAFPASKFILTVRDADAWLNSYKNFFPDQNNGLRKWMYGVERLSGNEDLYRQLYIDKNAEIIDYFKDRPDDFLVMELSSSDGWLKLVNFLGDGFLKPFPHTNRAKTRIM